MSIDDWRYSDQKMKVREQALKILFAKFGGEMDGWFLNTRTSPSMNVLKIGFPRVTCILLVLSNITRLIMQKVINVLALLSFLGTSAIIGGGTYVFSIRTPILRMQNQISLSCWERQ